MMNDMMIKKYEANGFSRWTRNHMDRLYVNVSKLGLEVEFYKTGNVKSARWCGESTSNAEGRRFLASKVFVDVKTGELHVQDRTTVDWHNFDLPTIRDKAMELINSLEGEDE